MSTVVHFFIDIRNVGGGHAFSIHGQDLFFDITRQGSLLFLDELGIKFAFPIPGDGQIISPKLVFMVFSL